MLNTHKEMSAEYSRLPTKVRRNEGKIRHWKDGQIEELFNKLRAREIEIKDNTEAENFKTARKFFYRLCTRACTRANKSKKRKYKTGAKEKFSSQA